MENKVPISDHGVSAQWPQRQISGRDLVALAKHDLFPHYPGPSQICILGGPDHHVSLFY